ncbi:MAG: pyridoxamine 5'-phosphate oxidase family protein [Myxococcota bacterium]
MQTAEWASPPDRLRKLIEGKHVAMLTTVEEDGSLHSRPMWAQEIDSQGNLWFLTPTDSAKVHEVEHNAHVNVSFADVEQDRYVSISGVAQAWKDPARTERLSSQLDPAWFPSGRLPAMTLLRIVISRAQYWDRALQRMTQIGDFGAGAAAPLPH